MRQPLNKLAIAMGISLDLLLSFVLVGGMFVVLMLTGMIEMTDDAAEAELFRDPAFLAAEFVLSLVPTVIAGYVTGRIAKRDHVRHAVWVGVVMFVLYSTLTFIPMEGPSEPLWFDAISLLMTVPAALAGGYLSIPPTTKPPSRNAPATC
jgi:hypothetical protein